MLTHGPAITKHCPEPYSLPQAYDAALTFLRDEPAVTSPTCSTCHTTVGVQRNTLIQVLQLLRFRTACWCVRDASGSRSAHCTPGSVLRPAGATDRFIAAHNMPFG